MKLPDASEVDQTIAALGAQPTVFALRPGIQHYAWGDTQFIPALLGIDNPQRQPYAELWLGAHPNLPSRALLGGLEIPLDRLMDRAGQQLLGPAVARRFGGRLPYLLKVLSAAAPLSIQVHATKQRAEEGFARENAAGIPLSAPNRNYRDDNHKPELIAGLTDFYGLRGFRPLAEIAQVMGEVPELRRLDPSFRGTSSDLRALYAKLMNLPQDEVDIILRPLVDGLRDANASKPFARSDRRYWVLRADNEFSRDGHADRGLFSIYLLNLVHLRPGEAMYLPAGVLHAYLEGAGMEIMANSNNVLRGGLTAKHVDVPELLRNVAFEAGEPEILRCVPIPGKREWAYRTPAREFELRRVQAAPSQPYEGTADPSAEILVLTSPGLKDAVTVTSGGQALVLGSGDAFFVPFGVRFTIDAVAAATFYKATVPATAGQ